MQLTNENWWIAVPPIFVKTEIDLHTLTPRPEELLRNTPVSGGGLKRTIDSRNGIILILLLIAETSFS